MKTTYCIPLPILLLLLTAVLRTVYKAVIHLYSQQVAVYCSDAAGSIYPFMCSQTEFGMNEVAIKIPIQINHSVYIFPSLR